VISDFNQRDSMEKGTAVIDWFSFTFDGVFVDEDPGTFFRAFLQQWMDSPICGDEGNGLYGFKKSVSFQTVRLGELLPVAVVAWGGENQKNKIYVSINGSGCSLINDWRKLKRFVESVSATITRVDVAVDALNGEFTLDSAQEWYDGKGFNAGGRKPLYSVAGDWLTPTGAGRTFYVGRRQNGKYCRIYEKGKQLGNRDSTWTRFEVELHNTDREIPYDIISHPSEFFSGSYPCCEGLVEHGAQRIKTLRAEHEISLEHLKAYCRIAYGKLVHVLRFDSHTQDADSRLLDDLAVVGVPRRLGKTSLTVLNNRGSAPPEPLRSSDHGNAI
jgi:phage replication initiation protein